jgi:hypothetical protein
MMGDCRSNQNRDSENWLRKTPANYGISWKNSVSKNFFPWRRQSYAKPGCRQSGHETS